jgi:hypothetical protein
MFQLRGGLTDNNRLVVREEGELMAIMTGNQMS